MCGASQVNGAMGAGPVRKYTPAGTNVGGVQGGGVVQQGAVTQSGGKAMPSMPGMQMPATGIDAIAASPPNANKFIEGSLAGSAGKDFKLEKGAGFKGKKGRDPNGNDQKQNNLKQADANRPSYGIPKLVAGTDRKPNYVQDIQVSIGMGGLEALRPDVLQKLVDNQNAGKGSVWNGVAYLTGLIDQQDGSVPPELVAQRSQIMQTRVGNSGKTLQQWVENPKDENGTNWARSNHAMTGIQTYLKMEQAGIPSEVANKLANNDDMMSGAGRIDYMSPGRSSNNQENTFTGQNAAERKEWAKAAQYAKDLNRTDILQILMGGHTMGSQANSELGNKGAKSKLNENLGIDPNMSKEQRQQLLINYFMNNPKDPKSKEDKAEVKKSVNQQESKLEAKSDKAAKGGGAAAMPPVPGGGAGMPDMAMGGGCAMDPSQGASLIGGGPADSGSIAAILQQLVTVLQALAAALATSGVAGASGGGPMQQGPSQLPPLPTPASTKAGGAATKATPAAASASMPGMAM